MFFGAPAALPWEPHLRPLGLSLPMLPPYCPLQVREPPISQALLPLWGGLLRALVPTPPPRPQRL